MEESRLTPLLLVKPGSRQRQPQNWYLQRQVEVLGTGNQQPSKGAFDKLVKRAKIKPSAIKKWVIHKRDLPHLQDGGEAVLQVYRDTFGADATLSQHSMTNICLLRQDFVHRLLGKLKPRSQPVDSPHQQARDWLYLNLSTAQLREFLAAIDGATAQSLTMQEQRLRRKAASDAAQRAVRDADGPPPVAVLHLLQTLARQEDVLPELQPLLTAALELRASNAISSSDEQESSGNELGDAPTHQQQGGQEDHDGHQEEQDTGDDQEEDNGHQHRGARSRSYSLPLNDMSPTLRDSIERQYSDWRLSTINGDRLGGRVAQRTIANEIQNLRLLLGWMHMQRLLPAPPGQLGSLSEVLLHMKPGLNRVLELWIAWLREQRCIKWSTISSYVKVANPALNFVTTTGLLEPGEGVCMRLRDQVHNIVSQCSSEADREKMYRKALPLSWQGVHETRMRFAEVVEEKLQQSAPPPTGQATIVQELSRLLALEMYVLQPPDRVGIVRQLRYGYTLQQEDGHWVVDLTDPHRGGLYKNVRYHGPLKFTFIDPLQKRITRYIAEVMERLQLDICTEGSYLFFQGRDLTSHHHESEWGKFVGRIFRMHSACKQQVAPSKLRPIYITWLRDPATGAPEHVLRAAAYMQKHLDTTQASDVYDRNTHDTHVRAATDFTTQWIRNLEQGQQATPTDGAQHPRTDKRCCRHEVPPPQTSHKRACNHHSGDTSARQRPPEDTGLLAVEKMMCIACRSTDDSNEDIVQCAGAVEPDCLTGLHEPLSVGWHWSCLPADALEVDLRELRDSPEDQLWACKACATALANRGRYLPWRILEQRPAAGTGRQEYLVKWLGGQGASWVPFSGVRGTAELRLWRQLETS